MVNTPVPIMFATTSAAALASPIRRRVPAAPA
jgi:hypothetical protein